MSNSKSVRFNNIRAGQTLWIANPHCSGRIDRVLVTSKPKRTRSSLSIPTYSFKGLFSCSNSDKLNERNVYFNAGGFIKMFRSRNSAEKYLCNVLSNNDFIQYDEIRLSNIDKSINFLYSSFEEDIEENYKKLLLKLFRPQNFKLPTNV